MMPDLKLPDPRVIEPGDWYRRLHGPYVAVFNDCATGDWQHTPWLKHLDSHLAAFEGTWSGLDIGFRAAILDRDGWMAYGMSTDPRFVSTQGHPAWWGCELGFATLESLNIVDPVELAMRESIARTAQDSDQWWRMGT